MGLEVSYSAVNKWTRAPLLKTLAPSPKNTSQNSTSHISLSHLNELERVYKDFLNPSQ
jgi:hypothetical protein